MKFFSGIERERKDNTLWVERWRPKTLDDYIGTDELKHLFQTYINDNDIPHLLFYGKAGIGKTTLAKIIVNSIECDHIYINASDENSVDVVRTTIKSFASSVGFKDLKVVILDEMDYFSPNAQAALRNLMETFSQHTRFILTCNYHEKIIDPIISRCQSFELTPLSRKDVAITISKILTNEGISFDPSTIALIVNQSYPDIRKCINNAQRNSKFGKLKINEQSMIAADYKLKILSVLKEYKSVNGIKRSEAFNKIRKIVADNRIRDFPDMYRFLYDNMKEFVSEENELKVIVAIADSQYRDSFVVDSEITFMSGIIQILNVIK